MASELFSVAVFPFLKTSGPVTIGGYEFRSTDDVASLPAEQATAVKEIAEMLFAKDDMRVLSASYTVVPYINFHSLNADYFRLAFLRSVVAYIYSMPHDIFGSVLLAPEEASLVILSPEKVSDLLVSPKHHTKSVAIGPEVVKDAYGTLQGYYGVYNFTHHFWVSPQSRIYGLKPQITLNISQDLRVDFELRLSGHREMALLLALINKPLTGTINRVITSLHWYNAANEAGADSNRAILHLAVAFEALLKLPSDAKSERIVDAISLLLGRTERLNDWARQFYDARSRIAHEGFTADGFYYVPGKARDAARRSGSLMQYGRQVFRLCLSTLLVGADLAEQAQLREKFVANNERYEEICRALDTKSGTAKDRLSKIESTVAALERFQFVRGAPVVQETAIGAIRRASLALLESGPEMIREVRLAVEKMAASKGADGEFEELSAVYALRTAYEKLERANASTEEHIVGNLVEVVWMDVFDRYFRLLPTHQSKQN